MYKCGTSLFIHSILTTLPTHPQFPDENAWRGWRALALSPCAEAPFDLSVVLAPLSSGSLDSCTHGVVFSTEYVPSVYSNHPFGMFFVFIPLILIHRLDSHPPGDME